MRPQTQLTPEELEYISSLNSATLSVSRHRSRTLLYVSFFSVIAFFVWSAFAMIDETTSGVGKVIPSSQIQKVQSLEGGIVEEISVSDGERITKGQPLLRLSDIDFAKTYDETRLRYQELQAKSYRLEAEASGNDLRADDEVTERFATQFAYERSLYETNRAHLKSLTESIQEQILQAAQQLEEAKARKRELEKNHALMQEQIKITQPLVARGVVSEIDFIKLKREANTLYGELRSTELSMPRLEAVIEERRKRRTELTLDFQSTAKEELSKTTAEMLRLREKMESLRDKVRRATLRAPVDGTVKRILVSTIGEVVQPGSVLVEIVAAEDVLVIEAKIKPSDIAFLHPDQDVVVKFTAYDFIIYGGLEGKLYQISPDSIIDEEGNSVYLVRIKTDKNHLGSEAEPLEIIPGMTTNVEILTGKRSVLQFLLKPILRAKESAFRER